MPLKSANRSREPVMSTPIIDSSQGFATFQEFYPFYLGEHANRTCRRLHFAGSLLVLAVFL